MNEYLNQHNIYALLQNAMEDLLIAQPEQPLEHLEHFFRAQDGVKMVARPQVVLIGPPGSKKGAQAEMLAKHFGIKRLSPPSLLKEAQVAGNKEVGAYLQKGEEVPDNLLNPIVFAAIQKEERARKGWILDGYPKTDLQAFALKSRTQPTHVIEFTGAAALKQETVEVRVFKSTINGIRDVFKANITAVNSIGLTDAELFETLKEIVSNRHLVLDKMTREVLPRGPGLVTEEAEVRDLNIARVQNTKPKIEEV